MIIFLDKKQVLIDTRKLLAPYQTHRLKLDSKTTESLNSWKMNNSLISENEVTQTQKEKFTFMWILVIKQMIAKL